MFRSTIASSARTASRASDTRACGVTTGLSPGYVNATNLNVRARPDASSQILLQVPRGTRIVPISRAGDWLEVPLNDGTTAWVSSQFVVPDPPAALIQAPVAKPAPPPKAAAPTFNRAEVVQAIIDQSIRSTGGNCPCPYNTDRAGRRCGGRSAYSRPGGASPICFPDQVSDAMIQRFVNRSR